MSDAQQQLIRGSNNQSFSELGLKQTWQLGRGLALCGAGTSSAWPQRSFSSAQRRGLGRYCRK